MKKLKIVFMGTPEFAVGILHAIRTQTQHQIIAVITAPDKPAGRGQKIKLSAVKDYALQHDLPLLQPTNLKSEDFLQALQALQADLQIVVAFRMLPKLVWDMPILGTFNLHASLLPNYRGAAPINWAIINGETTTGVTTFFIDDKIDTGAIILQKQTPISDTETAGQLHDRLITLGCTAVIETLDKISTNTIQTQVQTELPTHKTAYKLDKDNCKIDFTRSINTIYNLIRGLSPYPAAYGIFKDGTQEWQVKIYEVLKEQETHNHAIGTVITNKKEMRIAVNGGYLKIISLQFPGKKRMTTTELLNGMSFSDQAIAF